MRVEVHFTYTIDDVRDAIEATAQVVATRLRLKPTPPWQRWVGTAISFIIIGTMAIIGWGNFGFARDGERLPPVQDLVFLLAASVLPALTILLILLRVLITNQWSKTRATGATVRHSDPQRQTISARILGALLALVMAPIVLPVIMPSMSVRWQPSRGVAVLIGVGPWLLNGVLLLLINRLNRRRAVEVQWNASPRWRRRKTMVFDDDVGLTVADESYTSVYRWPYFRRARETDKTLLLDDEESRIHILPKRAVRDEIELARVRAIVQNHIAESKFLPQLTAFPVVTTTPTPQTISSSSAAKM
jgi:hypothetical protein